MNSLPPYNSYQFNTDEKYFNTNTQTSLDLDIHRFQATKDSSRAIEDLQQQILSQKATIENLQKKLAKEKVRELKQHVDGQKTIIEELQRIITNLKLDIEQYENPDQLSVNSGLIQSMKIPLLEDGIESVINFLEASLLENPPKKQESNTQEDPDFNRYLYPSSSPFEDEYKEFEFNESDSAVSELSGILDINMYNPLITRPSEVNSSFLDKEKESKLSESSSVISGLSDLSDIPAFTLNTWQCEINSSLLVDLFYHKASPVTQSFGTENCYSLIIEAIDLSRQNHIPKISEIVDYVDLENIDHLINGHLEFKISHHLSPWKEVQLSLFNEDKQDESLKLTPMGNLSENPMTTTFALPKNEIKKLKGQQISLILEVNYEP